MNSRRTNTPFTLRSKEVYKQSQKNTITKFTDYSNSPMVPSNKKGSRMQPKNQVTPTAAPAFTVSLTSNAEAIRRSTSFKNKVAPYRRALGCTYYRNGFGFRNPNYNENQENA